MRGEKDLLAPLEKRRDARLVDTFKVNNRHSEAEATKIDETLFDRRRQPVVLEKPSGDLRTKHRAMNSELFQSRNTDQITSEKEIVPRAEDIFQMDGQSFERRVDLKRKVELVLQTESIEFQFGQVRTDRQDRVEDQRTDAGHLQRT